jgi:hypothetical protein
MKRRGRREVRVLALVCALALMVAAMSLAGCGRADFTAGSTPDVPAAIAKAGAAVLDQGTAKNYFPGGKAAQWFVLGKKGSGEPSAVVSVLTFDSRQARDAAASQLDNSRRAGARTNGVYTVGDAVILVDRITDKATVRLLDQALRDAGAK